MQTLVLKWNIDNDNTQSFLSLMVLFLIFWFIQKLMFICTPVFIQKLMLMGTPLQHYIAHFMSLSELKFIASASNSTSVYHYADLYFAPYPLLAMNVEMYLSLMLRF